MIVTCDVAAGLADGKTGEPADPERTVNTLVVPTRDVIVTVERDQRSDPEQADTLVLRSAGGAWESQEARPGGAGAHVDEGTRRIVYRFADVPHGAYRVSVDVGDGPRDVVHDLVVRRAGVFAGDRKLGSEPPRDELAPEIEVVDEELGLAPAPLPPRDAVIPVDPAADRALLPPGGGGKGP